MKTKRPTSPFALGYKALRDEEGKIGAWVSSEGRLIVPSNGSFIHGDGTNGKIFVLLSRRGTHGVRSFSTFAAAHAYLEGD